MLVIIGCTDLFLYFFHLFNSVPFKVFGKIFICLVSLLFEFCIIIVHSLNAVCSVHTWYDVLVKQ